MPLLAALLLLLTAAPAYAQDPSEDASSGFPIALVVLALVAVGGALAWRAYSKKREGS